MKRSFWEFGGVLGVEFGMKMYEGSLGVFEFGGSGLCVDKVINAFLGELMGFGW